MNQEVSKDFDENGRSFWAEESFYGIKIQIFTMKSLILAQDER